MDRSKSIDEQIADILVDCYTDDEQRMAWCVTFEDEVAVPFSATLLGESVEVRAFRAGRNDTPQCRVARIGQTGKQAERWFGVEDLDDEGLPDDMAHVLMLYRYGHGGED
jgi:hypothetical protein